MKPVLSIVIPVYNVAPYVEKCIRSCYDQNVDKDSYEVIVVNDGSTDTSLEICTSLQKEFKELIIISQKNKGLSGARNTGLGQTKGDYVWFVDSDDWIEKNCINYLLEAISNSDSDLFWVGHDVYYQGKFQKAYIPKTIDKPITGEELFIQHLDNLFYIWRFVYKTSFLHQNNLNFMEGILYEDLEFTPRALLLAKKCVLFPKAFYHYLMREGSIVNQIKNKNISDRFLIIKRLSNTRNLKNMSKEFKSVLDDILISSFKGTLKMCARSNLLLPSDTFNLHKELKKNKIRPSTFSFDYMLLNLHLKLYYKGFSLLYKTYRSFKN